MVNLESQKDLSALRTMLSGAGLCLASLAFSASIVAAPAISSVSGSAAVNSTITVSGSGFGSGPNVILYDDFESGGALGDLVDFTATVGNWTEGVGLVPQFDSVARSGSKSMRIYRDGRTAILKKEFVTPATEVFFSFWVRVPDGTVFPGDSGGVREFSNDSSWKMAWLIDSSYDGSSSDICVPTHAGSGNFYYAGNDYSLVYLPKGNTWWSWSSWMRMSVWVRAEPSNPTGAGRYSWHVTSSEKGQFKLDGSEPIFDSDGPAQKVFRYLNIPGWIRQEGNSRPVYDDVYIASGANAQARIEIGDASTYAASKTLTLLIPESWSSSSISARLPVGALPGNGSVYIYITDKDGNVNSQGYTLAKGVAPNPPTSVSVQ